MCTAAVCPNCNKPTYRGCGAHIEQVLAHVPKDARCKCREKQSSVSATPPSDKPSR